MKSYYGGFFNKTLIFDPFKDYAINQETRLAIYNVRQGEFSHLVVLEPKEVFRLKTSTLETHMEYKFKYQIKQDGKWVNHIKSKYILPESQTEDGLKYLFYPKENSTHLVVGFQAINKNPTYNYINCILQ